MKINKNLYSGDAEHPYKVIRDANPIEALLEIGEFLADGVVPTAQYSLDENGEKAVNTKIAIQMSRVRLEYEIFEEEN